MENLKSKKGQGAGGADSRRQGILEEMTVSEVRDFRAEVLLIPLGSTEPHGPHLPYGTDTTIADCFSSEAVRLANLGGARVLRLPPLPIGNNVNFKDFPFACRIRVETLMAVLSDLVLFGVEEGVRKIIILNCHGGNDSTVAASLRQLFDDFQDKAFVAMCGCGGFSGDLYSRLFSDHSPHAGEFETSLMQFLAPGRLPDKAPVAAEMNQPVVKELSAGGVTWVRRWASLMPASCGGRPDLATPEKGRQFFEADVAGFSKFLISLSETPWHPQFPYSPNPA